MSPEVSAALVAAPVSLAGALAMRWFEMRARADHWSREDRQRFLQEKRQAYSTLLADCQWHFVNRKALTPDDHLKLLTSQTAVLLLAPKEMVRPVQVFVDQTFKVAGESSRNRADDEEWARQAASLADTARADLGSDLWSTMPK